MRLHIYALAALCLGAVGTTGKTSAQTTPGLTLQKTLTLPTDRASSTILRMTKNRVASLSRAPARTRYLSLTRSRELYLRRSAA